MSIPYTRRYAGGFADLPSKTTPVDSQYLNGVEDALVALLGVSPATNGALVWDGTKFRADAKIKDANVDAAAAIARSKLNFGAGLVDADIAAAAAIAQSKIAFTPWQAYSPSLSFTGGGGSLGNGSIVGRYVQIGKTVICRGAFTLGSTTVFGTGGIQIGLPVNIGSNDATSLVGTADGFHPGTGAAAIFLPEATPSSTVFTAYGQSSFSGTSVNVSSTFPWTWVSVDRFRWSLMYEGA